MFFGICRSSFYGEGGKESTSWKIVCAPVLFNVTINQHKVQHNPNFSETNGAN